MSSSSSLGSLSSSKASSKGSLSSLSFTDIYGLSSTTPSDPTMLDLHRRVEKILMGSSPNHHQQQQQQQQQNPRYFGHQVSVPELNCIGESSQYSEQDGEDKRQVSGRNGTTQQTRLNSSRSSSSSLLSSPQQTHETSTSYSSHPPPYTERKALPHLANGQVSLFPLWYKLSLFFQLK